MSKFSTVVLTVAGVATVAMIGVAASATAATLPMITSSSSSSTSTSSVAPSPSPSVTPSPTASVAPSPSPSGITADIYVEFGFVGAGGPKTFAVTGVPVGAGPELTGRNVQNNPNEYCGDLTVDVSLDPTTITVTGNGGCSYSEAYVKVTLHGLEFSSTTVLSDALFSPNSANSLAVGLPGGSFKARGVHFGSADPYPVLDSYGVTGSTFSAYWSGGARSPMDGVSVFRLVPVALADPGAASVPTFTG